MDAAARPLKVGCHYKDFEAWAAKILGQGWSVARVEETKDKTEKSGGIIRREVVEILTPALDRGLTRDDGAAFLLAIAEVEAPEEEEEEGDATYAPSPAARARASGASSGECTIGVVLVDAAAGRMTSIQNAFAPQLNQVSHTTTFT